MLSYDGYNYGTSLNSEPHTPPSPPMLSDVLANSASPPYTLSAFTAFLSQNHCLETLEFTKEALRYQDFYREAEVQFDGAPIPATSVPGQQLQAIWKKLLSAYIVQGSPREVNLPSEERDPLLNFPYTSTPPPPKVLDQAIKRIHDLMQESIFLPFLNSLSRPIPIPVQHGEPIVDPSFHPAGPYCPMPTQTTKSRRQKSPRRRTPPSSTANLEGHSRSPTSLRPLSSNLTAAFSRSHSRGPTHVSHSSSGSADSYSMNDDSSMSSPLEPMTPPTTPPSSELFHHQNRRAAEHRSGSDTWRKMSMKLGWKKRSSSTLKDLNDER